MSRFIALTIVSVAAFLIAVDSAAVRRRRQCPFEQAQSNSKGPPGKPSGGDKKPPGLPNLPKLPSYQPPKLPSYQMPKMPSLPSYQPPKLPSYSPPKLPSLPGGENCQFEELFKKQCPFHESDGDSKLPPIPMPSGPSGGCPYEKMMKDGGYKFPSIPGGGCGFEKYFNMTNFWKCPFHDQSTNAPNQPLQAQSSQAPTQGPSSAAPSSAAPSTGLAGATQGASSAAPSSSAPSSSAPSSSAPSSSAPSSAPPSSAPPSSAPPSSAPPSTAAPSTNAPSTAAPSTALAGATQGPSSAAPSTQGPSSAPPSTAAPTAAPTQSPTEAPTVPPSTAAPSTQQPSTEAPTTANPCTQCTLDTIALTAGSAANATSTPITLGVEMGDDGCSILRVNCTAPPTGIAFMQFNEQQGGPNQAVGNPVVATLHCKGGLWYYAPGNGLPDRWIQEVDCQVQADAGLGGSTAAAVINN